MCGQHHLRHNPSRQDHHLLSPDMAPRQIRIQGIALIHVALRSETMTDRTLRLQEILLEWGTTHRRQLPWRENRHPYHILVAETMLTQTQVGRVTRYYQDFLSRFPTPFVLAESSAPEVLESWVGLGYNRRALRLRQCAQVLVEEHDGLVPDVQETLRSLPGVGAYTANAILAQAFNKDVSAVDTNARRVLVRAFVGQPMTQVALQIRADSLVPHGRSWEWTQAIFDLGALICRVKPSCDRCPLAADCLFDGHGLDPYIPPRRQSTFAGSRRQYRGQIVRALAQGVQDKEELRRHTGLDADSFNSIYQELKNEGFFGTTETAPPGASNPSTSTLGGCTGTSHGTQHHMDSAAINYTEVYSVED